MAIMELKLVLVIMILFKLHISSAITDKLRIAACDNNNRRIIAAHVTSDKVRGKLECYFEPKGGQYLFRFKINELRLAREGTRCPSVKFIGFTSKKEFQETQTEWEQPDRRIMVPADPEPLKTFNCDNYKSATGLIFETSTIGQKLLLEYDTKNVYKDRLADLNFVVTSFVPGTTTSCPKDHFKCWNYPRVCIDKSLECDTINNCYDDSDEDNFKCTGRVAGILLPLFIIIIILVFILLIAIVITVILFQRRRSNKIAKNSQTNLAKVSENYQSNCYPERTVDQSTA